MKKLSILIPTFNDECVRLVEGLCRQADALCIDYEVIVADDCSTRPDVKTTNRAIAALPHCTLIEQPQNLGRAAIRNFLARQSRHPWLLFLDSDMVLCREDFVRQYAEADAPVVDGGVVIGNVTPGNLRSMYENAVKQEHTAQKRRLSPYQDFHTANFMVRRDVMLAHPFDMRFRYYGYEDVLFGKTLKSEGIPILHIDNPMSFEVYESNADFVSKTEEGLRTLHAFRHELAGYSRLLAVAERLPHWPLRLWHRLFGQAERRNLTGSHPSLRLFSLYRLGYYLSLDASASKNMN